MYSEPKMDDFDNEADIRREERWLEDMSGAVEDYEAEKDSCSDCDDTESICEPLSAEEIDRLGLPF